MENSGHRGVFLKLSSPKVDPKGVSINSREQDSHAVRLEVINGGGVGHVGWLGAQGNGGGGGGTGYRMGRRESREQDSQCGRTQLKLRKKNLPS